jgi:hypothetical protein
MATARTIAIYRGSIRHWDSSIDGPPMGDLDRDAIIADIERALGRRGYRLEVADVWPPPGVTLPKQPPL